MRRRAEHAIRASKPRRYLIRVLEQLASAPGADSATQHFAHVHLGELLLDESPWRAALQFRRALALQPQDDGAHAMCGLSLALLGHFGPAVAHYRRATQIRPSNPWYLHNLGHLLDVGLGESASALVPLRRAVALQPGQREISAALALCLARTGKLAEAQSALRELPAATRAEPSVRSLIEWIDAGCPTGREITPRLIATSSFDVPASDAGPPAYVTRRTERSQDAPPRRNEASLALLVADVLVQRFDAHRDRRARALQLWNDYVVAASPSSGSAAAYAAAVEYALARIEGAPLTQRDAAQRYGVSPSAVQSRFHALRSVLELGRNDSRYGSTNAESQRRER